MKASVLFFPNLPKKDVKSGNIPIYMRVCYCRSKAECRLNAAINENELQRWDPITMRIMERNSSINHYLNSFENRFTELLILNPTLQNQTAASIRNFLIGVNKEKKKMLLMRFVDDYFEKAVMNNVNRTPGTIKNYRRAINHLRAFIIQQKKLEMLLEEIDFEFASDFKNYLITTNPSLQRVGMTEVSASSVIKKFRTIFTQAVDEDLLKRNPFKKVKIKTKSPKRERLTIEQVKKISTLNLSPWPYLPLYRDIFLFSVYTGLAYHDAMALTWNDLEERRSGDIKLSISRQKTDVITECFLPVSAIQIVKKYRNNVESEIKKKVLPYRSNKEVNEQLKKLAQLAGVSMRLSTHIARHTFRQILAEAGITDMGVIKRLMGQSRNGDVDEVYYQVTEKGLLESKNKLDYLINSHLCQS